MTLRPTPPSWPGLVRSDSVRTPPIGAKRQERICHAESRSRGEVPLNSAPPRLRVNPLRRADARRMDGRLRAAHDELVCIFNQIKNSSPQPLTQKTQFLHPRDAGLRLHVCPKSRSRGGFGASAAPPSGGRGARYFAEQLSCRREKQRKFREQFCCRRGESRRQAGQPQRPQAWPLRRQAPCGEPRLARLYAGYRCALRRNRPDDQSTRRSRRDRPVHHRQDSALATRGLHGMDGGR